MLKIKFHPAFWALAAVLILQNRYLYLLSALFCSLLHELGHARAAYNRGYTLKQITIMPYGAVLYGGEQISIKDSFSIAIAGPLTNILLAVITIAFWWISPAVYTYTQVFCQVNIMIALFNLLPFYPLDGSRIILAFSKNRLKTLKILRFAGVGFSILLMCLFIVSFFIKINFSIGIMSIMVFISATSGTQKESYAHIATLAPYTKNLENTLDKKTLVVSHNLRLIKLLKHIKNYQIIDFCIIDDSLTTIKTLSENELSELCIKHDIRTKLKDCI